MPQNYPNQEKRDLAYTYQLLDSFVKGCSVGIKSSVLLTCQFSVTGKGLILGLIWELKVS
jgi:hypothetical protein